MPTLLFANRDALRLALASGGLPSAVTNRPAQAGNDSQGRVWLQPARDLPRESITALSRLGVGVLANADVELSPVTCWLELLPLQADEFPPKSSLPVLFELPAASLAGFVAEIHRVSPSSELQFRVADLEEIGTHALVRVDRPPYLALLRAGHDSDFAAYIEQAPRIWVEAGFRHPLAEQIVPPEGQVILIRAPSAWSTRSDRPFEVEARHFALPAGHVGDDRAEFAAIDMPLRLAEGGHEEPAELWVIQERPMEQLAGLVGENGTAFLSRFRLAVAEAQGQRLVLLWARPSKRPPPPPLVSGLGCRPYLKLPNLFVPCCQRLVPSPRRDVLRRFTSDGRLTLLLPDAEGGWLPVSVVERAFEPLENCIEYVAGQRRPQLNIAAPAHLLDLENFAEYANVILDEPGIVVARPPAEKPTARSNRARLSLVMRLKKSLFRQRPEPKAQVPLDRVEPARPIHPTAPPPPDAERIARPDRRAALEARFVQPQEPDDATFLPELAGLHAQLGNAADAAICWLNAIWQQNEPPELLLWGWLQAEKKLSRLLFNENDLAQLVETTPSSGSVRLLAASVVWQATRQPEALAELLGPICSLLEAHEEWLPARAAWLAQMSLARISHGDVLALARCRDRLAVRLAPNGLSLELDVPAFVRFSGRDAPERFQAVRDWLVHSRDLMHRWADQLLRSRPVGYCRAFPEEFPDHDGRCTKAFIDLMLAWGLARLSERQTARQLAADARMTLNRDADPVLKFLGNAFQYRIDRALENVPPGGPLPPALQARFEQLRREPGGDREMLAPYRIESLGSMSRILEPSRRVNPYYSPLPDSSDTAAGGNPLAGAEAALARSPADLPEALRLLDGALTMPAAETRDGIAAVFQIADRIPDPLPGVLLLAKAFERAAIRGDRHGAEFLLPRLGRLFRGDGPRFGDLVARWRRPDPPDDPRSPDDLRRLEAMPGYCLRDLQRLGLLAEAEVLLFPAVNWVLHGKPLENVRSSQPNGWPSALRAVLRLAGNWFNERDEKHAVTVLNLTREILLYDYELAPMERAALARSYAMTLGHASPRMALGRFEEMFRDLRDLHDQKQTNSHYALSPLTFVDTVVRAVLSDHFTVGPAVRRWMDADEFRVRQRCQRDLSAMLAAGTEAPARS